MRADQGRIRDILKETILALLNNGVEFTSELEVDGLLGVTIDKKDVFLVKISEVVASQRRHAGGDKESSDEDAGTGSSSKGRKKRRSPSPKNKGEKRQRVASPTQSIPSSSTSHKADNAKAEKAQVNIDLTSVKSEPVDTTVSDSNHSMGDMSDVGPSFDYNQQQPHITSIQAVAQTPDAESAQGTWSQHHQGLRPGGWPDEDEEEDYSGEEDEDYEDDEAWEEEMYMQHQQMLMQHGRGMPMQHQHGGMMQQNPRMPGMMMMQPRQPMPPFQQQMMKQQFQGHAAKFQKHQQMMQQPKAQFMPEEVDDSESESDNSDDDKRSNKKRKKRSGFDYYKSNPKHPDITKAINEGSKAVLEKIIGMSMAKAQAGKKKDEKARKKKERQNLASAVVTRSAAVTRKPIPFIKDTVDAQVVVKQEPLDAGDAELVVRPIPPPSSANAASACTVSSTSSIGPSGLRGNGAPRTPMGPPPPPPPKDPSQDFLNYPMGPPLNTQFSPAAMKTAGGAYKCDICPFSTPRPSSLQKHRLKEHGEGETEFNCPECSLTFFSAKEVQQHCKSAHKTGGGKSGQKASGDVLICDCHGKTFRSADSLSDHLKKVARDECLTCQTCGKLFVRKDALLNHIQTKHGAAGMQKQQQGAPNKQQQQQQTKPKSPVSQPSTSSPTPATPTTSAAGSSGKSAKLCNMCGEGFSSEELLTNHLKSCTRSKLAIEKPDNFYCDDCQLEFPTEIDLNDHMMSQHKDDFNCDICEEACNSEQALEAHMSSAHPEEME